MVYKIAEATKDGGIIRDATPEEEAQMKAQEVEDAKTYEADLLKDVRQLRNQKLQETDYLANSDLTMSDEWKAKRQSWRDIPQNYTTVEEYKALLKIDKDKTSPTWRELTHTVWSKP